MRLPHTYSKSAQAKDSFPVLGQFENNWATAMIAASNLQNVRGAARKRGHFPKRSKFNRGGLDLQFDSENHPREGSST